jgi:hypothetical protein
MEGNRSHLEAKTHDKQRHTGQQHAIGRDRIRGQESSDFGDVGGAGGPVGEGDPVEE